MWNLVARLLVITTVLTLVQATWAQSPPSPPYQQGKVRTIGQINNDFSQKQDYLGAPPCLATGCTFTGPVNIPASTVQHAPLNIGQGTAPSTPFNGDIWETSLGLFAYVNGVVYELAPQTFSGGTLTNELVLAAANNSRAGLNVPNGTTPSVPNDGDVWATAAGGLLARINGVTYSLTPYSGSNVVLTPPGSGGVAGVTAQSVYERDVSAVDYGARGSSSTYPTGTAITSGQNTLTLPGNDFQVGDGINLRGRGAAYGGGSLTGLTAVVCGVPGSIAGCAAGSGATPCTYYVTQDDGSGGVDAAQSVVVANAPASIGTVDSVYISYTPTNSNFPGPIWKNCGAGDVYVGAAQPFIDYVVTPGSGYTDGGYLWTASGGGCANPPTGWVQVLNGKLVGVQVVGGSQVDPAVAPWSCTSAPTVAIPGGAGAGAAGAIALALKASYNDTGVTPLGGTPNYLPASHPASPTNDNLLAKVGTLSGGGTTASLCTPSSVLPTCTPANAAASGTNFLVTHSWAKALQTAITAAPSAAEGSGAVYVDLPCGTFDLEPPLTIVNSFTILRGRNQRCTTLRFAGIGNRVQINPSPSSQLSSVGVEDLTFDSSNATSGYDVSADRVLDLHYEGLNSQRAPCSLQALGFNTLYLYHDTGNAGWADQCDDFDMESTSTHAALVPLILDAYHNHTLGLNSTGGTQHHGYVLNDVPSGYATGQCANSSVPGYAFWLKGTSGFNYQVSTTSSSNVNFSEHLQCDSEYSRLDTFRVDSCVGTCENDGFVNGAMYGVDLFVGPLATFHWTGGHLNGAGQGLESGLDEPGAYLAGINDTIGPSVDVGVNSQNDHGSYPGVEVGPSCLNCSIKANVVSNVVRRNSTFGLNFQSAPVNIDAGATLTNASTSGAALTFASLTGAPLAFGETVYDPSNALAGCPNDCPYIISGSGLSWTLNKSPGNFGPETILAGPSRTSVVGATFRGNVVNHVVDNSGMPGNVIADNSGDDSYQTAPTVPTNGCGSTTQGTVAAGSSDYSGAFTVGTVTVTSCHLNFALPHGVAPKVVTITPEATGGPTYAVSAGGRTNGGFTATFSADASSRVYDYTVTWQ